MLSSHYQYLLYQSQNTTLAEKHNYSEQGGQEPITQDLHVNFYLHAAVVISDLTIPKFSVTNTASCSVKIISTKLESCLLFRNKDTSNSMKENQHESEQKVQTSSATNDDCVSNDDEDKKPVITSPVSHLWKSEDGITPIVRPEDATSTGIHKPPLPLCMGFFIFHWARLCYHFFSQQLPRATQGLCLSY